MIRKIRLVVFVGLGLVALTACAGRHPVTLPRAGEWGVYRARLDGAERLRFRVLLWVSPPDRIHVEVTPPVGGPEMIVDAGGERLVVVLPTRRIAYAGGADPEVLGTLLGSRRSLASWVGILLGHEAPPETIVIEGDRGRMPRRVRVLGEDRSLDLELRKSVPVGKDAGPLGTGEPPAGFEILDLADLEPELYPWEAGSSGKQP